MKAESKNFSGIRSEITDGQSLDALNDAWYLMHYALRAVIAEPDRILATLGLTRLHHRILFFVAHKPEMTVGTLQTTLDISKQALNSPLRQLQDHRLIAISKAPFDARVRLLQLTDEGVALEERLTGAQRKLFAKAFENAGMQAYQGWLRVMYELSQR